MRRPTIGLKIGAFESAYNFIGSYILRRGMFIIHAPEKMDMTRRRPSKVKILVDSKDTAVQGVLRGPEAIIRILRERDAFNGFSKKDDLAEISGIHDIKGIYIGGVWTESIFLAELKTLRNLKLGGN